MKRTEKGRKSGRFFIASMSFVCAIFLMPSSTLAGGDYCVLSVGDLNADGIGDYAVGERPAAHGHEATAYIFFGGGEPLPDHPDEDFLKGSADLILRGPSAAPFSCSGPSSRIAGAVAEESGKVKIGPAVSARRPGESPLGRPVFYTVGVDLNPLSPGNYVIAAGINGAGEVVGRFLTGEGFEHAFLFDGEALHDLGTLGGHFSEARAVNSAGNIVGYSLTGETDEMGFVNYAFISDGDGMQDLGIRWSAASDINDRGQVVGEMQVDPGKYHAFLYENGEATDLGTLDGEQSFATAVNEAGQVVGEAGTFVSGTLPENVFHSDHAFLFDNGTMHDLGSLGYQCYIENEEEDCYEYSSATDINNFSQIAGFSTTFDDGTHPFLITDGAFQDLSPEGPEGFARAVNDSGQVVGSVGFSHPFLYDLGTMYDLWDLIVNRPGDFAMWEAVDINNFGQIVGVNYLLDPLYEKIDRGMEFAFSDVLGPELTFEYWVSIEDPERCVERSRPALIEYRLETRGSGGQGGWQAIENSELDCDESEDWRTASIPVPAGLEDSELGVRIRLNNAAGIDPTVYLRHFR